MAKSRKLVAQIVAQADKSAHRRGKGDAKQRDIFARVIAFASSSEQAMSFETSLNSFERRLVHELAEENGLKSESTGEGSSRYVTLSKRESEVLGAFTRFPSNWLELWSCLGLAGSLLVLLAGLQLKFTWSKRLQYARTA
ncbi:unnamed protein product [Polarella glacialis]|uniref:R3H domain-containing protein n=1 Tax=Polarella glacialis TaxID=89957 RepID=A0A813DYY6_POLGL|nr:unnamed protein product [Polarella glacialis]